jgi:hypothetical protein
MSPEFAVAGLQQRRIALQYLDNQSLVKPG